MPFAELATGIRMYYEERGAGEPLVLLYGTGGSHVLWEPVADAFARHFRLILPDPRGTGFTDKPVDEPWPMALLAADLVALLDALGIDAAHVGGLSQGSAVAQEVGIRYPERARSLSLYNTWGKSDAFLRTLFGHVLRLVDSGDADATWAFESFALFSPDAHERRPELMEWFRGLYASGAEPTPREAVLRLVDANLGHDTLDRLHLIRAPTLVVAGEQDMTFMSRYPLQVAERIPGARLELLTGDGSSHLLHLERRDEFLEIAIGFLLAQEDGHSS